MDPIDKILEALDRYYMVHRGFSITVELDARHKLREALVEFAKEMKQAGSCRPDWK